MDYSRALRTCRAMRGWKQEDVAEKAGLSTPYISLIEAGRRTPSPTAVSKLARGLGVPEALLTLLAMDFASLPARDVRAYEKLGESLLELLVESSQAPRRIAKRA